MPHNVGALFQNVLLVGRLPWIVVVNDIGYSVFISSVRHDADMSFKDHIFLRHLWSRQLLCARKIPSGFVPGGNLCLHPALLPYNLVAAPGYLRSQAPADHIRHFSTHKQLHPCKPHNHRQDNRSHNSGFCILDVYSHRPVHRLEYPAGHLHRHHPDLRRYETAVSYSDCRPQAGTPMCAGNVSAHKTRCCITVKVPVPLYNALLYLC